MLILLLDLRSFVALHETSTHIVADQDVVFLYMAVIAVHKIKKYKCICINVQCDDIAPEIRLFINRNFKSLDGIHIIC